MAAASISILVSIRRAAKLCRCLWAGCLADMGTCPLASGIRLRARRYLGSGENGTENLCNGRLTTRMQLTVRFGFHHRGEQRRLFERWLSLPWHGFRFGQPVLR